MPGCRAWTRPMQRAPMTSASRFRGTRPLWLRGSCSGRHGPRRAERPSTSACPTPQWPHMSPLQQARLCPAASAYLQPLQTHVVEFCPARKLTKESGEAFWQACLSCRALCNPGWDASAISCWHGGSWYCCRRRRVVHPCDSLCSATGQSRPGAHHQVLSPGAWPLREPARQLLPPAKLPSGKPPTLPEELRRRSPLLCAVQFSYREYGEYEGWGTKANPFGTAGVCAIR